MWIQKCNAVTIKFCSCLPYVWHSSPLTRAWWQILSSKILQQWCALTSPFHILLWLHPLKRTAPPNFPHQPLILLNTVLSPNKMQQQSSEPKKRKKNGFSFCSMLGVEMFYVFCIEENERRKNEKLTQQREKKKKRFVDAKIQLLRKSYKLQRQQEREGEKKQKFVNNLVSKLSELGGFFFL